MKNSNSKLTPQEKLKGSQKLKPSELKSRNNNLESQQKSHTLSQNQSVNNGLAIEQPVNKLDAQSKQLASNQKALPSLTQNSSTANIQTKQDSQSASQEGEKSEKIKVAIRI